MSWQPEIDELAYRKRLAAQLGGPDKVKRHKDAGKLTVRERIEAIADPRQLPGGGRAHRQRPVRTATAGWWA